MNEPKTNERLIHVSFAIQEFFANLNQRQRRRDPPARRRRKSPVKQEITGKTLFEMELK